MQDMSRYSLGFENCVRIGDDIWFSESNYNGLYRYSLKEKTVQRIADFPNEDMIQQSLYIKVRRYGSCLIFVPCTAKFVSIYNIETNSFSQVEIPHLTFKNGYEPDYYEGIVYRDMLYVIGSGYPLMIKICLKDYKVRIVYNIFDDQVELKGKYFGTQVAVSGNLLYIPCCYLNAVLVFDMDLDEGIIVKVGDEENRYMRIVQDNEDFYLVTMDTNHIVRWNERTGTSSVIKTVFRQGYCDAWIHISETSIWMISNISGEVYKIDKTDYSMRYIDLKREMDVECSTLYQEGVCLLDHDTREWYYLDGQGNVTDLKTKILEPRTEEEVWKSFNQTSCINYTENMKTPISYYIYRMLAGEKDERKESIDKIPVGERVWHGLTTEV